MTQRFKYVGEVEPVDLPTFGLVDVNRGTFVEVDDPDQADAMHSSPNWEHVPDPQRSKAAKKAAKTRSTTDDGQEG